MFKKGLAFLLFFILLFSSLYAQDEVTEVQEVWTIRNNTWLLWRNSQFKNDAPIELKQVWKGTKVTPIDSYASCFKVRLPSNEYGYINYNDIEETYWVENVDSIKFFYGLKWGAGDYEMLPPGTRAYRLETLDNGGIYKVRLKDGRIGTVIRHYMTSPYFRTLPEVNQKFTRIYSLEKLQKKLIGKSREEAIDFIGPASDFIFTNNGYTASELYFRYAIGVQDKKRHKGLKISYDGNVANEITLLGGAKKSIAERLPLAGLIRKLNLNWISNSKSTYYEKDGESWWSKFRKKNFFTKVIGFIVSVILLFLFFSIPQFISWPFRRLIIAIKPMGNGLVKFFNFILLTAFMYFFFLVLTLFIILDQFIIIAIFTLVPWFIFMKRNNSNINYNRCPRCHTMWSAADKGSTHTGTEESTAWKKRDVDKGTTETSTERIKHIERHWDEEVTTTENYLDHRKCQNCGYEWDVHRRETSKHTIQH
jgi:Zn-finger nucleic acid-binding protein